MALFDCTVYSVYRHLEERVLLNSNAVSINFIVLLIASADTEIRLRCLVITQYHLTDSFDDIYNTVGQAIPQQMAAPVKIQLCQSAPQVNSMLVPRRL